MGIEELKDFIDNAHENWMTALGEWTKAAVYGMEEAHPGTFSEYLAAGLAPLMAEQR